MNFLARLKKIWSLYREESVIAIAVVCILITIFISYVFLAPRDFVSGTSVTIQKGSTLREIALSLEKEHVVRSAFWFQFFALTLASEKKIEAGEYTFKTPMNSFEVARMFAYGERNTQALKITIPEGLTNKNIAELLSRSLSAFNVDDFLAKAKEGYAFPDTYFFAPEMTADDVLDILTQTFESRTKDLQTQASSEKANFDDVVKMASILEKEARTAEDMKMVSDILWRRIKLGIPLQVDASFVYILGKGTADLTLEDLATDSPYNSYTHKGLPPTPISNPGIRAIDAALNPTKNPYLFFLTGKDGEMHYSKTFEEHIVNKKKYL